ncbi:Transcriptional regulatory protein OmpR [Tepidimonas alkaliphilus]|uniref:Transcriptional regulatory protein OmpR n=1 Tax=Tepidimonas alkaliphilus TaxID=2588942 RepID=A0A554W7X2_9BURK|nr:response regulator transcription factor [Tepidimonas alkaliphilus]TSE19674.1 Transcriptional regulatory protein OmpR [Tepidimonas alkaliphilus]
MAPKDSCILLVDDDLRLAGMLAEYLGAAGLPVQTAASLTAARQRLRSSPLPQALVLDLMLPDGDGLDLCRELRAQAATRTLPVLMLSARGEPADRVVGLELGADDYLPKPFEARELLARLRALLRRAQAAANPEYLRVGDLELDLGAHQVRVRGQRCELTAYQFQLLALLARHAGRVLTRDQIMDALKGHPQEAFDRSIDVHISRIRAAIEDDPRQPRRILTVRGHGYLLARSREPSAEADQG